MYKQSVKAAAEMQSCFRVLSIARIDAGDRPHVPRAPIQNRFDVWYSRRRSAPGQPGRRHCSSDIEIRTPSANVLDIRSNSFSKSSADTLLSLLSVIGAQSTAEAGRLQEKCGKEGKERITTNWA